MNLLWTIPLGLLVGVTLGALGGGGAVLTVPALVYLLGQEPGAATTGSLIIVGITAVTSLVPHYRKGNVRPKQGLLFGVLGVVGSLVGARLSVRVSSHLLMTSFAALLVVVSALMIRKLRRGGDSAAGASERHGWPLLVLTATGVGLLTGFFGVGGGFAVVPALTLVMGFSMPVAVGTSLVVIAINSATALSARLIGGGGSLDWAVLGGFTVAAVLGSILGGKVAGQANPRHLSIAFVVMLCAVSAFMLIENVPHLIT